MNFSAVDEEEDTFGPVALTFNDRSDLKEKLRSKNLIPHATQAPLGTLHPSYFCTLIAYILGLIMAISLF